MISRKHKCIFVSIPKTASRSIRQAIGIRDKGPLRHRDIYSLRASLHSPNGLSHRIIRGCLEIHEPTQKRWRWRLYRTGMRQFYTYFKFGFVRNPWDRTVSLYSRREGLQVRDLMSFDTFVGQIQYSSATCRFAAPHVNQLDWLVDPNGNVLVDFIGRYEHLQRDWATVAARLGIKRDLPHRNENKYRKKHYTEYYSEKTREIIRDKFKTDIEYFGYEFGD